MLIDKYFEYQIEYEKKYGLNTLVLMQVGSFFEFYGIDNQEEKIGNSQYIAELLNIQLTRRNKAILENSRSNCLMAGFPLHALKRFIQILLQNNYTIVLIEQTTEPPNPKREITQIYSPGTYIEEINNFDVNNIVCLYLNEEKCYKTNQLLYIFGLSSIDLSTGINTLYETSMGYYDKNAFFEEIYRFIENNNPKEIIVYCPNTENLDFEQVKKRIHNENRILHCKEQIEKKYFQIIYQNEFLKKIFPNTKLLSGIEYLDLEKKQYCLISYLLLLQFSLEHNERIVLKIKKPSYWHYEDHLILYNNAMYQLNIFPNMSSGNNSSSSSHSNSLFKIIDKTSTSLGRRYLKYILHNPITNTKLLNKRYNLIEEFKEKKLVYPVEKILKEICDIERMHRKISLNTLHPYEFLNMKYSYENIISLFNIVRDNLSLEDYFINQNDCDNLNSYINTYTNLFNLEEMGKYNLVNITSSFFKIGNYEDIDKIQEEIDTINNYFKDEMEKLSNFIDLNSGFVKMEYNERDGYFLYTTKKRADVLEKNLPKNHIYEIKKYTGTNVKIVNTEMIKNSALLIQKKDEMKIATKEKYILFLNETYIKYETLFTHLSDFICNLDFIKCGAKIATYYCYNKPIIEDKYNKKSYLESKEIRHPIIEVINENYEYVSNDINLDYKNNNGILLYGVNGVGKSSLSKAIGCNILLAQIGFFVPCSSFTYYPYKKIFTRINGEDNIFKGMSSFVVEMDELRSILKYSDENSIVLGDEICKGTEETSALSIVSASILRFCKKNVQFILATHFHKLQELEQIKNIENIHFKHLSIEYKDGKLIYGRKLLDGCGDNLYGIEIANFIIDDKDFIEDAKHIRNNLLEKDENIVSNKKSNYNSKLYISECSICGKKEKELDTHHIIEQNEFKEHTFFKNKLSNLVILCHEHHHEVHNGNLKIYGYFETENGKELKYDYKSKKNKKKKYDENQIKIIQNIWEFYKIHKEPIKISMLELKKKDIFISKETFKKIISNNY
jgi:DNA mismatch repair protein MutS